MTRKGNGPENHFAPYDYKSLIEALKSCSEAFENPMFDRALNLTYALVSATVSVDFPFAVGGTGSELDLALSFAWEDMHIAFTGHGYPLYTGAVLEMFYSLDTSCWDVFSATVAGGMQKAHEHTEANKKDRLRRYLPLLYSRPPISAPQDLANKVFHSPFYGGALDAYFISEGVTRDRLQEMMELYVQSLAVQDSENILHTEDEPQASPSEDPDLPPPFREMGRILSFPFKPKDANDK